MSSQHLGQTSTHTQSAASPPPPTDKDVALGHSTLTPGLLFGSAQQRLVVGGAKEQTKQWSSHRVSVWDVTADDFDVIYSTEMTS